ncbi:molecular chaperone TorD [Serratia proteamaculans]|uniref:molecular chaperone TorD n=1 Tax=Serratia proteamaculans TaxID=28151 RepID=UPI0010761FE9|nr:molecular chaperone TorD [Serratia proteamaculans]TFZ51671.1 molecular chaperone TorD [Serratia proteamaculans]
MQLEENRLQAAHYSCFYSWLSGCFARELNQDHLAQLNGGELTAWLALMANQPELAAAVEGLRNAIERLQQRPDAQLELAADFAGLFLMSDRAAALPYASCYQTKAGETCFNSSSCDNLRELFIASGLAVNPEFTEPEDHLALTLELLSYLNFVLCDESPPVWAPVLKQKTLEHCLGWLPEFDANCSRHDPFGFYAALSVLLLSLMRLDAST